VKCHNECTGASRRWPQVPQYFPGTGAPQFSQRTAATSVPVATAGAATGAAVTVALAATCAGAAAAIGAAGAGSFMPRARWL